MVSFEAAVIKFQNGHFIIFTYHRSDMMMSLGTICSLLKMTPIEAQMSPLVTAVPPSSQLSHILTGRRSEEQETQQGELKSLLAKWKSPCQAGEMTEF